MVEVKIVRLGDVAYEYKERIGEEAPDRPVYGVDKSVGLTDQPRYQSSNLSRYKRIEHGMFAYNPMRLNIGSIGFCHYKLPPGIVSPDYVVFGCRESALLPKFMDYHTRSAPWSDWLSLAGEGSVRERIYFRKLEAYQLLLPSLSYQKAAVEILSTLDRKIELNKRVNEALQALVQAIFKDWFVDFGPTRRRKDGATDPVAILGGLIQDPMIAAPIADLFPGNFNERLLPEGWTTKRLDESLVLQRGFDLPKKTRTDGKYPVVAASGPSGTHNDFKVKGPGVCTGRSGVIGSVFLVRDDFWPLNTSLWIKDYPHSSPLYAYFLLQTINLMELNAGSAVPTLNRNHVHQIEVVTPPMKVITAFDEIASSFDALTSTNETEIAAISETRDYLLPRLMSGAMSVQDIKAMAE